MLARPVWASRLGAGSQRRGGARWMSGGVPAEVEGGGEEEVFMPGRNTLRAVVTPETISDKPKPRKFVADADLPSVLQRRRGRVEPAKMRVKPATSLAQVMARSTVGLGADEYAALLDGYLSHRSAALEKVVRRQCALRWDEARYDRQHLMKQESAAYIFGPVSPYRYVELERAAGKQLGLATYRLLLEWTAACGDPEEADLLFAAAAEVAAEAADRPLPALHALRLAAYIADGRLEKVRGLLEAPAAQKNPGVPALRVLCEAVARRCLHHPEDGPALVAILDTAPVFSYCAFGVTRTQEMRDIARAVSSAGDSVSISLRLLRNVCGVEVPSSDDAASAFPKNAKHAFDGTAISLAWRGKYREVRALVAKACAVRERGSADPAESKELLLLGTDGVGAFFGAFSEHLRANPTWTVTPEFVEDVKEAWLLAKRLGGGEANDNDIKWYVETLFSIVQRDDVDVRVARDCLDEMELKFALAVSSSRNGDPEPSTADRPAYLRRGSTWEVLMQAYAHMEYYGKMEWLYRVAQAKNKTFLTDTGSQFTKVYKTREEGGGAVLLQELSHDDPLFDEWQQQADDAAALECVDEAEEREQMAMTATAAAA